MQPLGQPTVRRLANPTASHADDALPEFFRASRDEATGEVVV